MTADELRGFGTLLALVYLGLAVLAVGAAWVHRDSPGDVAQAVLWCYGAVLCSCYVRRCARRVPDVG